MSHQYEQPQAQQQFEQPQFEQPQYQNNFGMQQPQFGLGGGLQPQFGLQMPQLGVPSAAFSTQFQPMQFDAPQLQTTGSFVGFPNGGQPNFVFYPEFKNESESEDTTLKAGGLKTRDATANKKSKKNKGAAGACGCF